MNSLKHKHKPAEFLKWACPPSIFGTIHYIFRDIKMRIWNWSAKSLVKLHGCVKDAKANRFRFPAGVLCLIKWIFIMCPLDRIVVRILLGRRKLRRIKSNSNAVRNLVTFSEVINSMWYIHDIRKVSSDKTNELF